MAQFEIVTDDPGSVYGADLAAFSQDLEALSMDSKVLGKERASTYLGGDVVSIRVAIDPATIKLIFHYAAAVFATYKGFDYLGEFFRSVAQKLGDTAGSKIVRILDALWQRLMKRTRSLDQSYHSGGLMLGIRGEDIEIASRYAVLGDYQPSDETILSCFNILVYRLLPLAQEFSRQAKARGARPKAFLRLEILNPPDPVLWYVTLLDCEIVVGPSGAAIGSRCLTLANEHPKLFALITGEAWSNGDLEAIAREIVAPQRNQ